MIHMPFVTPDAQRYLHLGNVPNLEYSPTIPGVTENPGLRMMNPVYRLGTDERYSSL